MTICVNSEGNKTFSYILELTYSYVKIVVQNTFLLF